MISNVVNSIALGALVWGGLQTYRLSEAKAALAAVERDKAYAETSAWRESNAEVSRLVTANQKVQRDYQEAMDSIAEYRSDRYNAERVRSAARKDVSAAATRVAGACGNYAEAAERDLEWAERERSQFGQEAAAAAAAAHALKRTIDERRNALEARRNQLMEN